MADLPPKRGEAYEFYTGLISQADTKLLKANPTLATGDVKVSKDGGAFANLATLPTVTPASGVGVRVQLSASEMDADNVTVAFVDAAGAEWCDQVVSIQTASVKLGELSAAVWDRLTSAITTVGSIGKLLKDNIDATISSRLSPTIAGRTIDLDATGRTNLGQWKGTVPNNLSASLNVPADTQEIGATALAALAAAVWAYVTRTITGGSLTTAPPTAAAIADAVWDEALADHSTAGTAGKALSDIEAGAAIFGETGSIDFTYTVYKPGGVLPLANAAVYCSSDSSGVNRSQTKLTDALGQVHFDLNPGTVYFWPSHPDYTFTTPDTETVS